MTHPHQLSAEAAIWSLRAARAALDVQVTIAQRERGLALVEAADGLHSQTYGNRHALGGHPGDPTAGAALHGTTAARTSDRLARRVEQLAARTDSTLTWLADQVHAPAASDPLDRLTIALPSLRPSTAEHLRLWLTEADQRIRKALSLPPDEYRTADQLASELTTDDRPITADRIRDWARRARNPDDRLHGLLPGVHAPGPARGTTWYRLRDARRVMELTKPQVTGAIDGTAA